MAESKQSRPIYLANSEKEQLEKEIARLEKKGWRVAKRRKIGKINFADLDPPQENSTEG